MSNILVTGATGFIGSHTCKLLMDAGHTIVGTVRSEKNITELQTLGIFQYIHAKEQEAAQDHKLDTIIHCATSYGRNKGNYSQILDANLAFPLRLLDHALANDVSTFIYLDTCFTLDYPYLQAYTLSKKQMVTWGKLLSRESNLRFINLQLQHPFGPNDRSGKFIPWVIRECLQGRNLDLTDGRQSRDFIYVEDVAAAIKTIIEQSESIDKGFTHFECGRGKSVSVKDFVTEIHRRTNSECKLNFGAIATREQELMDSIANNKDLLQLGWSPRFSLSDGIDLTIKDQRNRILAEG